MKRLRAALIAAWLCVVEADTLLGAALQWAIAVVLAVGLVLWVAGGWS